MIKKEIEANARSAYNTIAENYNDDSHETVRNFEILNRDFLTRYKYYLYPPTYVQDAILIDVGGGRGWVAKLMKEYGYKVILGDISDQMLNFTRKNFKDSLLYCQLSAFNLPFKRNVARLITTMLCGAYLCKDVLNEIHQTLDYNGIYIASETPSKWVSATQLNRGMPNGKTWFQNEAGHDVLLPFSFIYTLEELVNLISSVGFKILIAETLRPSNILPFQKISEVNKRAAKAMKVSIRDLPVLSAVIAQRK